LSQDWNGADRAAASLELRNLSKRYGQYLAVAEMSLDVKQGEFITLLGPSGSGKSTTLMMIAGLVDSSGGQILMGGNDIGNLPPYRRNIGVVFQNYLLFPHMTVQQNVEFPLKQRSMEVSLRRQRVSQVLEMVGLASFADRLPKQLSGGQQQRVAVARALVFQPSVLLMDEPLGALDKNLRSMLQLEIKRIHRDVGVTIVYVTHDQEEALVLSDRIALFNAGKIEQVGTAEELYEQPATTFVARFLGESNILEGGLQDGNGKEAILVGDGFKVRVKATAPSLPLAALLVRPERLRVARESDTLKADNYLSGRVAEVIYLGSGRRLDIEVPKVGKLLVRESIADALPLATGQPVRVGWNVSDGWLIEAPASR
jgi:putative spermidine/putrescine transport system ATP-binding protein